MKILKKNELLEKLQSDFKIHKNYNKNISEIKKAMDSCIKFGAIPFAQSARHAFISVSLLKSMSKLKILSKAKVNKFEKSFETITLKFLKDINKVVLKKMSKNSFFLKYGHLRPGTYNLLSKNYREMKQINFVKQNFKLFKKKNIFSASDFNKIDAALDKNKLGEIRSSELLNYISTFISYREYSKFVFTKNVNFILELIQHLGLQKKLKKKDLVYLKWNEILQKKNKREYLQLIQKRKIKYKNNLKVKLPEIILDSSAVDVIPYMFNIPNFITSLRVRAKVKNLDGKIKSNLKNCIVLVTNADPGYDWIFAKGIKGLITQYGGANSHMAIRCAELGIPAAIGCGEKKFEEIIKSNFIELDCSSNTIKLIS